MDEVADFLGLDANKFANFEEVYSNKTIGMMKRNVKVETMLQKPFFKFIERNIPSYFWIKFRRAMYKMASNPVTEKPEYGKEVEAQILQLLKLDILEAEKLMGRRITEWKLDFTAWEELPETQKNSV